MNTLLRRLVLRITASLAAVSLSAADGSFVSLFNGRDLTGWVNVNCAPETFTVWDGMIHCDGVPTGALRTARPYENFILELEWRHLKSGGNAGVFIWSSPLPAVGQPFLRAIEVQVLDHGYGQSDWYTTHGDVFPIHGATMKPFSPSRGDRSFPREHRSKGTNEWNHYRIVANNGTLRLSVNGAEVSGGSECNWRKGYIALESEGGWVDWRNLRIQELPSTDVAAENAAPAAESWKSLYDGRGFRGWALPEGSSSLWKSEDWNLRCDASTAPNTELWSASELHGDRVFFDWKWDGKSGLRVPPAVLRFAQSKQVSPLPALDGVKADGWNRLELQRRGASFELKLNGKAAGTIPAPAGPFHLGLRPGPVPIRFASLFVK